MSHPVPAIEKPSTYLGCAAQWLNFCILFVLLNVVTGFGFTWYDKHVKQEGPVADAESVMRHVPPNCKMGVDPSVYQGYNADKVDEVLNEFSAFSTLGFPYASWTGYDVHLFHARYFNIDGDAHGLPWRRGSETSPAPPGTTATIDIWAFGGSTCFSLDVADEDTVPSCLEKALNRRAAGPTRFRVINWGRPGYYSSQEAVLLQQLLKVYKAPAAVVFFDGVNDCIHLARDGDAPTYSAIVAALMDQAQKPDNRINQYAWIPLVRLAMALHHKLSPPVAAPTGPVLQPARVTSVYGHNLQTVHGICAEAGCAAYFFWQPVSFYHWDLDRTPVVPQALIDHQAVYRGAYEAVMQQEPRLIPLGDLAQSFGGKVYLDFCHYTPQFNAYLGEAMASHVDAQALSQPAVCTGGIHVQP